jgi:hypothetical protein
MLRGFSGDAAAIEPVFREPHQFSNESPNRPDQSRHHKKLRHHYHNQVWTFEMVKMVR